MHWIGPVINLYSCLIETLGGGYFWPLLATVNRSSVFIRFSRQITYANISVRLLGSDARPIKINESSHLPKWALEHALMQLS